MPPTGAIQYVGGGGTLRTLVLVTDDFPCDTRNMGIDFTRTNLVLLVVFIQFEWHLFHCYHIP